MRSLPVRPTNDGGGRYLSRDWRTHADFLQVLVASPAELTHRLAPAMQARGFGRIVNVASLAGLVPASAGHTLYGASKALLIRFSECLHAEMQPHGVHVTALCPGFTYTEFHDVNGMRARISRLPSWLWQDAASVAREGLDAVDRGQARCVTGAINRTIAAVAKYLPEPLAGALVASRAPTQRTPGAILRSRAVSGPMPRGNRLVTMTKKKRAVSTSVLRRIASSRSRRMTASSDFTARSPCRREWESPGGW